MNELILLHLSSLFKFPSKGRWMEFISQAAVVLKKGLVNVEIINGLLAKRRVSSNHDHVHCFTGPSLRMYFGACALNNPIKIPYY
jgi:hypothetical protein